MMDIFDLFRILIYFILSLEGYFAFYLYWFGYYKIKRSFLIGLLSLLFLSIGFLFSYSTILAITTVLESNFYLLIRKGLGIIALPLVFFLAKFIFESTNYKNGNKKS